MAQIVIGFGTQFAQTTLQTITDTSGGRPDILGELWNRGDINNMRYCQVGIFATSSAGSYSTTGRVITATDPGTPIQAGGSYINIATPQDVRNFRIQAVAGGTMTLTGVLFR